MTCAAATQHEDTVQVVLDRMRMVSYDGSPEARALAIRALALDAARSAKGRCVAMVRPANLASSGQFVDTVVRLHPRYSVRVVALDVPPDYKAYATISCGYGVLPRGIEI